MSKAPPIRRLAIDESVRQIRAVEVRTLQYLLFSCGVVAGILLLIDRDPARQGLDHRVILAVVVWLVSLLVARPVHRVLVLDQDTRTLSIGWRLFGFMPLTRREIPWHGGRLRVDKQWQRPDPLPTTQPESGQWSQVLLMFLPFPLSLLAGLASDGKKPDKHTERWFHLVLAQDDGARDYICPLVERAVADELLRASEHFMSTPT